MKCSSFQKNVLNQEDLTVLSDKLRHHLGRCAACSAWLSRVIQIENGIPKLPIPATNGKKKAAVLHQVRVAAPMGPKVQPLSTTQPLWSLNSLVSRYWHGGLIAATLLIGMVAFLNLGGKGPQALAAPADPMLADLVMANVDMANADSPAKRMDQLAKVADQLFDEIHDIANVDIDGKNLAKLSKLYNRVLMEGIVDFAAEIPVGQRQRILPKVADRLAEVSAKTEEMLQAVQPGAVSSLKDVSLDSRLATKKLRTLINGGAS